MLFVSAVCLFQSDADVAPLTMCLVGSKLVGVRLKQLRFQSAMRRVESNVCGFRSTVCGFQSAVCGLQSAMCGFQSAARLFRLAVAECRDIVSDLPSVKSRERATATGVLERSSAVRLLSMDIPTKLETAEPSSWGLLRFLLRRHHAASPGWETSAGCVGAVREFEHG